RHQLDGGEAGCGHLVEPLDGAAEGADRREGADVQLEKRCCFPRPPAPVGRLPSIFVMIDDLARTGNIFWLEMRGRVGHGEMIIYAEFVERAGSCARDRDLVPAVGVALHRMCPVENDVDALCGGRPESKGYAVRRQFGPEPRGIHISPENARTERAG